MCQRIKVFPENVETIYKNGRIYVSMVDNITTTANNVLLLETLKDVCQRGVSSEARKLCGLSEDFSESVQSMTP